MSLWYRKAIRKLLLVAISFFGLCTCLLVLIPVNISPGAGSLRCGQVWNHEQIEDFLEPLCTAKFVQRNGQISALVVLTLLLVLLLVVTQRDSDG
jgi:hypothetical protein